ncbi:MAG: ribonuclease P protein component [Alphaproteobacteria bacterium]|nr:ribonuclease P protein component [Alphaproteobacteria bacterium]
MMALSRLKRRPEFLRVAGSGVKAVAPGLVLQALQRGDEAPPRVGFTASRRVGGAVERNRAKRRLRAAAAEVIAGHARRGHDYVLIARRATLTRSYQTLVKDLMGALKRLDLYNGAGTGRTESRARAK